jgi:hypothetical protein
VNHPDRIWDGNGGTLDPLKASQRDLLVALHIKMDNIVQPMLTDHEERIRGIESFMFKTLGVAALCALATGLLAALIASHTHPF